jgi:hypothetical protein
VQQAQEELIKHRRQLERAQELARAKASRRKYSPALAIAARRRELGRTGGATK